jgi:ABC-2 type transport system permease protein
MLAIFKRKLVKNWLVILGWGVGLALLGYYMFTFYDSFFEQNVNLQEMLQALPEGFMAFFGEDVNPLTPRGFLTLEFFSYIPVILGILLVSRASKLIRGDEENGTLELILSQPISRSALFWGRLMSLLVSLLLILVITWAGFSLGLETTEEITMEQVALIRPFVSLLAVLLVFLGLALLLSMVLPSGIAGLISGIVLISSFFITSMARLDEDLEFVNHFSPLKYYQSGQAIEGLDAGNLLILVGAGALFLLISWVIFLRRDLHFNA